MDLSSTILLDVLTWCGNKSHLEMSLVPTCSPLGPEGSGIGRGVGNNVAGPKSCMLRWQHWSNCAYVRLPLQSAFKLPLEAHLSSVGSAESSSTASHLTLESLILTLTSPLF